MKIRKNLIWTIIILVLIIITVISTQSKIFNQILMQPLPIQTKVLSPANFHYSFFSTQTFPPIPFYGNDNGELEVVPGFLYNLKLDDQMYPQGVYAQSDPFNNYITNIYYVNKRNDWIPEVVYQASNRNEVLYVSGVETKPQLTVYIERVDKNIMESFLHQCIRLALNNWNCRQLVSSPSPFNITNTYDIAVNEQTNDHHVVFSYVDMGGGTTDYKLEAGFIDGQRNYQMTASLVNVSTWFVAPKITTESNNQHIIFMRNIFVPRPKTELHYFKVGDSPILIDEMITGNFDIEFDPKQNDPIIFYHKADDKIYSANPRRGNCLVNPTCTAIDFTNLQSSQNSQYTIKTDKELNIAYYVRGNTWQNKKVRYLEYASNNRGRGCSDTRQYNCKDLKVPAENTRTPIIAITRNGR
jgi:hypothetical protein